MTMEERLAHAKKIMDFQFGEYLYWCGNDGEDSFNAALWCARWRASADMYELLTGEKVD